MIKSLSFRKKIILLFVLTSLIPIILVTFIAYCIACGSMRQQFFAQNDLYLYLTISQLNAYFKEREGDARNLSCMHDVYHNLALLQRSKANSPEWNKAYSDLHQSVSNTARVYNYDLIFLTDPNGHVVYESSGQNILQKNVIPKKEYLSGSLNGHLTWSTIFYSRILKQNVLILSSPVRSHGLTGDIIGSINFVFNQQNIDRIVHEGVKIIGKSGDSYLIDQNGILLTNTKMGPYAKGAALKSKIRTKAAEILSGPIRQRDLDFRVTDEYLDYLGHPVLGSLGIVMIGNRPTGLVVEVDEKEAFAQTRAVRNFILISFLIVGAIGLLISFYFVRIIVTHPFGTRNPEISKKRKRNMSIHT